MTTSPHSVLGDSFAGVTLDDRYRLDGLIGRGGMASVYRGVDLSLGRPVAVKVFAEAAEGIDDAERRKSETALLASVSHRALVRLYDASRDPATGREFLVMELVDGRDLRETLRLGPLGPADAADMLADLAEALHVIHERGIVHRDVKPANVLLESAHLPTRTWNAKLADFGIARLIDDARITRTGLLVGTPGYLSPEQVSGARRLRPPTCTPSASWCSSRAPDETAFPGRRPKRPSARLVRDPDIPESLGADWVALLRAMTAREPSDRPSALDVAVAAAQLDRTTPDAARHRSDDRDRRTSPRRPTMAVDGPAASDATGDGPRPRHPRPAHAPDGRDRGHAGAPGARPLVLRGARWRRARSPRDAPAPASGSARPTGERRWVRPTIAIALLVTIGVVVVHAAAVGPVLADDDTRRPSRCRACRATSACTSNSSTRR